MNPFFPNKNIEVLKIIKEMDAAPNDSRPMTFWFYSTTEKNIYLLAHHLHELNMKIEFCGKSDCDDQEYLLIAGKWMCPTSEKMNNLCKYFAEIANRYDVKFDGWETLIGLDNS